MTSLLLPALDAADREESGLCGRHHAPRLSAVGPRSSPRAHASLVGWRVPGRGVTQLFGPGPSDQGPLGMVSGTRSLQNFETVAGVGHDETGGAASGGDAEGAAGLADHLVGEAPFVVVPGHHLDQGGVHDPGQVEVDDGGARVANDVGGDQRILRDAEDPSVLLCAASCRNASLTSCDGGRPVATNTMSAIDPTGIGARTAIPSNLPASSGTARVVARAAPVEVGTRLAAPARPRRKFLLGPSTSCWPAV